MYKQILQFIDLFRPFRVTLIDRYIMKEFIKSVFGAMVLFIVIYLFSLLVNDVPYFINQMEAGDKSITMEKIFEMYLNQIPHKALWVSPLAFLFSTMYTMGNLYKNNEAVAYIGAGVHIVRLSFFIVFISFSYSVLMIPFTDKVVVPTYDRAETLSQEMRHKAQKDQTTNYERFGQNNIYYNIKKYDSKKLIMHYPFIAKERAINGNQLEFNENAYFEEMLKEPEPAPENVKEKQDNKEDLKSKIESMIPNEVNEELAKKAAEFMDKNKDFKLDPDNLPEQVKPYKDLIPDEYFLPKPKNKKENKSNNPLNQDPPFKSDKSITYKDITDDFPEKHRKRPAAVPKPELAYLNNNPKLSAFFKSIAEPDVNLSETREDNGYLKDLEEKFIVEGQKKIDKGEVKLTDNVEELIDKSIQIIDKDKLVEPKKVQKKEKRIITKKSNLLISEDAKEDKNEKEENTAGVKATFEDLHKISQLPYNRDRLIDEYLVPKNRKDEVKTNFVTKDENAAPPVLDKIDIKEKNKFRALQKQSRPLEGISELDLMESYKFDAGSTLNRLMKEKEVVSKSLPLEKFRVPGNKYKIIPFPSYFEFRIDADKAIWDKRIKKWVAYNVEIRRWDLEKGLAKVDKYQKYVLNEIKDEPIHFVVVQKPMERMTIAEGLDWIGLKKLARKLWKEEHIDLIANKFAFQLSTFLIVVVGVSLGQFHSRKLIFINSLFKAIQIFLLYFVVFQGAVSLAKVISGFPIHLAPWFGNILFFIYGIYMLRKAKT